MLKSLLLLKNYNVGRWPICCNYCGLIDSQTSPHYAPNIFPHRRRFTQLPGRMISSEMQHFGVLRQVSVAPRVHTQNDVFILAWCCIHYSQKTFSWWTCSSAHLSVQLLRKSWMQAALSSSCFGSTSYLKPLAASSFFSLQECDRNYTLKKKKFSNCARKQLVIKRLPLAVTRGAFYKEKTRSWPQQRLVFMWLIRFMWSSVLLQSCFRMYVWSDKYEVGWS